MPDRPIVHLICNAHIDPVWRWDWEEGAREAVSTFHSAADLLDEFPEFVFNHNESLLYEWIEEYDLTLFERIQAYVKRGRWNISGSWYLQPDCNLVGGETLARVILEGRRYFQEKFGVRPTVAYNFDTFGHPGSLPQLLQQSGFQLYVHCRPTDQQMELPSTLYRWQGVDGTQVFGLRPKSWYCTPGSGQAQAAARDGIEIARTTGQDVVVLWGLGDHGGGATRGDLQLFREMIAKTSDVELRHSTPETFLKRVESQFEQTPIKSGDLQRTLAGCYTSLAPIKRQMREGEALLASAERWASIVWWRCGSPYPADDLRTAWKRLIFNSFHDTLCGTILESSISRIDDIFGYAHDVARRIITRSQYALLPKVEPAPDTIPLYVFNPHATPMRGFVGSNFTWGYSQVRPKPDFTLYDDTGTAVTSQSSGGNAIMSLENWHSYIGFVADVPPLAVRRYELHFETRGALPIELSSQEDADGITVENRWWRLRFSRKDAAPVELIDKASGRSLLKAPLQLFVMEDIGNAWGGENRGMFNERLSPFAALSDTEVGEYAGVEGGSSPGLRIIASGATAITVECLVGWQHTRASLQFTLYADLPYIDLNTRLHMQARRKMIKLVLPFELPDAHAFCEIPYGTIERPTDGMEYPCARWISIERDGFGIGVANNGQNGFDALADGTLELSITRGGIHSSWEGDAGNAPIDLRQSFTFMDQQQIDTLSDSGGRSCAERPDSGDARTQPAARILLHLLPTDTDHRRYKTIPAH